MKIMRAYLRGFRRGYTAGIKAPRPKFLWPSESDRDKYFQPFWVRQKSLESYVERGPDEREFVKGFNSGYSWGNNIEGNTIRLALGLSIALALTAVPAFA